MELPANRYNKNKRFYLKNINLIKLLHESNLNHFFNASTFFWSLTIIMKGVHRYKFF